MFKKPEIAYDYEKYYVGMSSSVIIEKSKKYGLKFLLGVLNSKMATYWFYKNGKERGVGVDIGVSTLREFPICEYDEEKILKLNKLIDRISIEYKNNSSNIVDIENEIDKELYEIYKLKSTEIEEIEKFYQTLK